MIVSQIKNAGHTLCFLHSAIPTGQSLLLIAISKQGRNQLNEEENKIGEHQLAQMKELNLSNENDGDWYAYQNKALDSSRLGMIKFLKAGPGCTFKNPPARYPDRIGDRYVYDMEINWGYLFLGRADLEKGIVNEIPYSEVAPDEIHGDVTEDGSDSG